MEHQQIDHSVSLFSILQGHQLGRGVPVSRGGKPATQGRTPKHFPKGEGLKTLSPEELLSVFVPQARVVQGRVEGYQRKFKSAKARSIAQWIDDNAKGDSYKRMLPVIEISVVGTSGSDYTAYFTDGQHRAAGAVMAGKSLRAVVTKRTMEEARALFALQGKAARVSRNLLIIDSDGAFEEYIQDAMTSESHPWSNLISNAISGGGSKTRMSATAAYSMLQIYIRGKSAPPGRFVGNVTYSDEFNKERANELSGLVAVFGNRQSNPVAYSAIGLRAIALAARAVFVSRKPHEGDYQRWLSYMPRFNFGQYVYIKTSAELADQMIRFWNRRLPEDRKAARID